jgi:hypothetical protein
MIRFHTEHEASRHACKNGGWYGYFHYTVKGGYWCWNATKPENSSREPEPGKFQTFGVLPTPARSN